MNQLVLTLVGATVFAGTFSWAWRFGAYRWRRLASVYRLSEVEAGEPLAVRRLQNLILRGGKLAWESHSGITSVSVHETGLAFALMFPFSIDRPAFFIPFADLTVAPTSWYLNTRSFELGVRGEPAVKPIIDLGLLEWIEAAAGDRWDAGYRGQQGDQENQGAQDEGRS